MENVKFSACMDEIIERSLGGEKISIREIEKTIGRYGLNKDDISTVEKSMKELGLEFSKNIVEGGVGMKTMEKYLANENLDKYGNWDGPASDNPNYIDKEVHKGYSEEGTNPIFVKLSDFERDSANRMGYKKVKCCGNCKEVELEKNDTGVASCNSEQVRKFAMSVYAEDVYEGSVTNIGMVCKFHKG